MAMGVDGRQQERLPPGASSPKELGGGRVSGPEK